MPPKSKPKRELPPALRENADRVARGERPKKRSQPRPQTSNNNDKKRG